MPINFTRFLFSKMFVSSWYFSRWIYLLIDKEIEEKGEGEKSGERVGRKCNPVELEMRTNNDDGKCEEGLNWRTISFSYEKALPFSPVWQFPMNRNSHFTSIVESIRFSVIETSLILFVTLQWYTSHFFSLILHFLSLWYFTFFLCDILSFSLYSFELSHFFCCCSTFLW